MAPTTATTGTWTRTMTMRVDRRTRETMMRMNWMTSTTPSLLHPMKMKTMQTTTEPTTRGRTEVRTAGKTSISRRKIYSHEGCKCTQYASLSRDFKLPVNAYFLENCLYMAVC